MIRVLIVENQEITRLNTEKLLSIEDDLEIVGLATNGIEAIAQVHQLQPDVVLMDIQMPLMDGQEAARHIRHRYPACKILMLTTFDEDDYIVSALMNIGVHGYLLKDRDMTQLPQAIRMAHQGYSQMSLGVLEKLRGKVALAYPALKKELPDLNIFDTLTPREQEILKAIAQGMNIREIAALLVLSPSTVRSHLSNMTAHLKLTNRSQLRDYAQIILTYQPENISS
jgi:DNA-binding NarL/FixJ family response regulator